MKFLKTALVAAISILPLVSVTTACEPGRKYCYYRLPVGDIGYANYLLNWRKMPQELWPNVLFHCRGGTEGEHKLAGQLSGSKSRFCANGCEAMMTEKDDRCIESY